MTEPTFRYLDEALVLPRVDGVNIGFQNGDLRLSFIVRDPGSEVGFVVVRQLLVDGTATPAILNQLNLLYEMHGLGDTPSE